MPSLPTVTYVNELENVATLVIECEVCHTLYSVEVDYEGYLKWRHGDTLLQHALPQNTHDERELLLSQTCGPCYDACFTLDDEDDDGT